MKEKNLLEFPIKILIALSTFIALNDDQQTFSVKIYVWWKQKP